MYYSNDELFPMIGGKGHNNICNTNANEDIYRNNNGRPSSFSLKKKKSLIINNELYEDGNEQKQKKLNNLEMKKISKLKVFSPEYSNLNNNNNQYNRYVNQIKNYDILGNALRHSKNNNNNLYKNNFNNNNINLGKNYELNYYIKINKELKHENESLKSIIDELNNQLNELKDGKEQLLWVLNKNKYETAQLKEEKEDIEKKLNKLEEQLQKKIYENNQLSNENMKISNQLKKEIKHNKLLNEKIKEYEQKLNNENSLFMNTNINFSNEEKELEFPKGEYYFQLIKDYNINEKENNNKKKEKKQSIQLYFSLNNVHNPNKQYSFKISIINNKDIDNTTFLGSLEERTGNNIVFGNVFQIDYFFEREQILIIEPIVNEEETEQKIEYPLCDLMKNNEYKLSKNIENIGILQINYLKTKNQKNELYSEISFLEFYIELNDNPIFEKKKKFNDVYYLIKNFKDGNVKRAVYKSSEYNFQINKKQKTSSINLESNILCENKDQSIFFELYIPSLCTNNYIGYSSFTLNSLESISKEDQFYTIKIEHNNFGEIGTLEINYNTKTKMTFEEFLKRGQINLDIAIDYTKSNGDPKKEHSLHYLKPNERNDYEKAIKSCGDIIGHYDSDQLFPVYGFGGIPQGSDKVSHCFNINFDQNDDPNIHGIDNIIKYYRDSLKKITLSTPTFFAPIIKKVINEINYDLSNKRTENHYYILMILTDGILKDMEDTINCIIDASKLPLSIVIIGIGDSHFTGMDILDGDEEPLKNSLGEMRKRDIVQFVKFNNFKKKDKDCGTELAEEVLKEIPRQIEEYYRFFGEFYEN